MNFLFYAYVMFPWHFLQDIFFGTLVTRGGGVAFSQRPAALLSAAACAQRRTALPLVASDAKNITSNY